MIIPNLFKNTKSHQLIKEISSYVRKIAGFEYYGESNARSDPEQTCHRHFFQDD